MAYGYRASITVDNTKVIGSSDLTNFPVLISGTYDGTGGEPDIRTVANGGKVQNADTTGGADNTATVPADLAFYDDTSLTTQYDHEVEKYDATTGEFIAWVRVPTLKYNVDTVFYMFYGDAAVTTSQENINGTWNANYTSVYHLQTLSDSTSSPNNLTDTSSALSAVKIGNGRYFNAQTDKLMFASTTTLVGVFSVQFWAYATGTSDQRVLLSDTATGQQYIFLYDTGPYLQVNLNSSASNFTSASGFTTLKHYVVTQDATNIKLYTNGVLTQSLGVNAGSGAVLTGFGNYPTASYSWVGYFDETRFLLSTTLSPDWIETDYNSENSPATFYTMGAETAHTGGGGTTFKPRGMTPNTKLWGN